MSPKRFSSGSYWRSPIRGGTLYPPPILGRVRQDFPNYLRPSVFKDFNLIADFLWLYLSLTITKSPNLVLIYCHYVLPLLFKNVNIIQDSSRLHLTFIFIKNQNLNQIPFDYLWHSLFKYSNLIPDFLRKSLTLTFTQIPT